MQRLQKKVTRVRSARRETWHGLGFGLEKKVAAVVVTATIVSFLVSLGFSSSNFTGYAIADLNQQSSNWAGVVFFFIGLVGSFFLLRKKT